MNIVAVPARAGFDWAREGARLFFARPMALVSLVGVYLGMVVLPTFVPVVGPAISGVLLPFATLALMMACREVAAHRLPTMRVFAAAFEDAVRRRRLFHLGFLYAALTIAFALVFDALNIDVVVQEPAVTQATPPSSNGQRPLPASTTEPFKANANDGASNPQGAGSATTDGSAKAGTTSPGSSDRELDAKKQPRPANDPSAALLQLDALLLQLLLLTPLFMAMWFAPVFVGWHLMSPWKAMFFSFFACWRNKWAMLLFGLSALTVAGLGSAALAIAMQLAGVGPVVANLVLAPWALCLTAFLYAAMYPMYRAVVDDPMAA